MLPDKPFAPNPHTHLRMYSVQHLLCQNLEARLAPRQLVEALLTTYRTSPPEWHFRELFRVLAARIATRFKLTATNSEGTTSGLDRLSDRTLIELAVRDGWGFGVAAPWGVSREADLLWAAAAALTKFHGCEHPNEIGD